METPTCMASNSIVPRDATIRRQSVSINQSRARRLLNSCRQGFIMLAVGSADLRDPAQMIERLFAIALLELPEAIILPGQHMVRIGLQRALVPDLRELIVAELAVGIADQV